MLAAVAVLTLGFTLSLSRSAYAWLYANEGVCANQIGSATAPVGYVLSYPMPVGSSCHSSTPFWFYDDLTGQIKVQGPYYRCCHYDVTIFVFFKPGTGQPYTSPVEYYQWRSVAASSCMGDGRCLES